jgi:2-polyprenyl-3-methyl-5-hydroxy-6-metoxy-1,4-benzoquinol methylase
MVRERVKEVWQHYWAQQRGNEVYLDEMSEAIISELVEICGSLKGKRVLEAGCGRGIISAKMAELGADV